VTSNPKDYENRLSKTARKWMGGIMNISTSCSTMTTNTERSLISGKIGRI
jgi:hypothetical protein